MPHTRSDAHSGVSYIRNPYSDALYSGEYGEGVEGPIAQGYIVDNKTIGSYISLPNVA